MTELINEDGLKKIIQEYGNIKYQVDAIKSSMETALETILQRYPEAQKEYEELQEELGVKLEEAEAKEKKFKKILDMAIDAFSNTAIIKDKIVVKSELAKVSLTKEVTYDPVAMDARATVDPTLLAFRTEKIKSRVTLNNL